VLDMQGILQHYRPLQIIGVGDVTDHHKVHGAYTSYLNCDNFRWQPEVNTRHTPQLYLGEGMLNFKPKSGIEVTQAELKAKLHGQRLRLPQVSFCWGLNRSIMLADALARPLSFSPILGVVTTPAMITDVLGDEHTGYTALSFHKALTYDRIEQRLAAVPAEQRPMLMIALGGQRRALFIHENWLAQWQAAGVDDVAYEFSDKSLQLKKMLKNNHYHGSAGNRDFKSVMDYQTNQGGHIFTGQ